MNEFPGMAEQPGSGALYGDDRCEYIFKGLKGTGAANFDLVRDLANSAAPFRGMYIDFPSCKLSCDQAYDTLFVVAAATPTVEYGNQPKAEGETVFGLSITYMEKPLEMHPDYLVNWNYDIFHALEATDANMTNPQIPALPEWWETAKEINIPPKDQLKFRWGKTNPPDQTLKSGGLNKIYRYLLLKKRTMPGVEVFPYRAPTVTERIYFKSEARAEANLKKANQLIAPKKTYIYDKDPKKWLVQPQGIEETGYYYIAVNHYIYADKWEPRLYP